MRAFVIPGPSSLPIREVEVDNDHWETFAEAINASLVQVVRICGAPPNPIDRFANPLMLVDEDAGFKNAAYNPRASILYGERFHGTRLRGDALVICETYNEEEESMEFCGLPDDITIETIEALIAERK